MTRRREFPRAVRVEIVRRATRNGVHDYQRPEYRHWINMKSRCLNPNTPRFERYGGRGISICDRWISSFHNFFHDLGPRPSSNHSLDRFPNPDGNYEPGNVRWATRVEQARNTSRNSLIAVDGKLVSVAEAAEKAGLNPNTVVYRLRRGWSFSDALDPRNFQGQRS